MCGRVPKICSVVKLFCFSQLALEGNFALYALVCLFLLASYSFLFIFYFATCIVCAKMCACLRQPVCEASVTVGFEEGSVYAVVPHKQTVVSAT